MGKSRAGKQPKGKKWGEKDEKVGRNKSQTKWGKSTELVDIIFKHLKG